MSQESEQAQERTSCDCTACQSACSNKPGWMKYGDEQKLAEHLGLTVKECFDKYLMVDFWEGSGIFILSPAVISGVPGSIFPYNPQGQCVFYKAGKCSVHKASPFECQSYIHTLTGDESHKNHREAMESWNSPEAQELIKSLLGYSPSIPEGSFIDILFN